MNRLVTVCLAAMCLAACSSSGGPAAHRMSRVTTTVAAHATPSPRPTRSPITIPSVAIPSPVAAPNPPPADRPVTFTGLPPGRYITHLHSACSGAQQFHIAVLPTLVVSGGTGTTYVAAGDFGRGLCVIVYGSPSLTTVLATRRV